VEIIRNELLPKLTITSKATLKIYFQNFKDFVNEEVLGAVQGPRLPPNEDGTIPEQEEQVGLEDLLDAGQANFLDLIFRSQKFTTGEGEESFNEKYYRIKAVLGWSVDPQLVGGEEGNPVPAPGKLFSPDLRDKIKSVGTTLLLSLLEHDIDFREDGTIELTLDYHAAVESMLTNEGSNLLYASGRSGTGAMAVAIAAAAGITPQRAAELSAHDFLSLLDRRDSALNTEMQEEQSRQSAEDTPQATGDVAGEDDECYDPYGERVSEENWTGWGHDVEQQIQADQTVVRQLRRRIMYDIYKRLLETVQQGHMFYIDAPAILFGEGGEMVEGSMLGHGQLKSLMDSILVRSSAAQHLTVPAKALLLLQNMLPNLKTK
jgi:hypothetical protein